MIKRIIFIFCIMFLCLVPVARANDAEETIDNIETADNGTEIISDSMVEEDNGVSDSTKPNEGAYLNINAGIPRPLNEIIENSYFILRCRFKQRNYVDTKIINLQHSEYVFECIDAIMGNYDEEEIKVTIYPYQSTNSSGENAFKQGEEYIIFLDKHDSLFGGISYMLTDSLCMLLDEDKIIEIYQRGDAETYKRANEGKDIKIKNIDDLKYTISGIIKDIESNNEENVVGSPYTLSKDPKEIVEFSPHIVKANVIEIEPLNFNDTLEQIRCETVESLKGDVSEEFIVYVPSNHAKVGEEYLLLLVHDGGIVYSITSLDSCIAVSDKETYDEYMECVELHLNGELEEEKESFIMSPWVYAVLGLAFVAVVGVVVWKVRRGNDD